MRERSLYSVLIVTLLSGLALAQGFSTNPIDAAAVTKPGNIAIVSLPVADAPAPVALPRMAPELALQVYHGRSVIQAQQLAAYSAVTTIRAELPDTAQQGEFELQRHFEAPHTLQFTALHYTGDGFVKTNVITRLL